MFDKSPFEIPLPLREMAEKNVEQARAALDQFAAMAKQAQDALLKTQGDSTKGGMRDFMKPADSVQAKAMWYAQKNVEAGFRLAADLAQARDVQEFVEIQTLYAQTQALTLTQQSLDLARMAKEAPT
jgi:hypothetical protein